MSKPRWGKKGLYLAGRPSKAQKSSSALGCLLAVAGLALFGICGICTSLMSGSKSQAIATHSSSTTPEVASSPVEILVNASNRPEQSTVKANRLEQPNTESAAKSDFDAREEESRVKARREAILKELPAIRIQQRLDEESYRIAKLEIEAMLKVRILSSLILSSEENERNGNRKEQYRLQDASVELNDEIQNKFRGTKASKLAQEWRNGLRPKIVDLPEDPDKKQPLVAHRIPDLTRCLDLAIVQDWSHDLTPIPATHVDAGVLKDVPYQSYSTRVIEFNVYGDPSAPCCIEIGIEKSNCTNIEMKKKCIAFASLLLTDARDRVALQSLKLNKDTKVLSGWTLEITPETDSDAYGKWWVSIYSTSIVEKSRASKEDLRTITSPSLKSTPSPSTGIVGGSSALPSSQSRPGTAVYVHGYTKSNGTYVAPHTRSAPGTGSSRSGGKR